MLVADMPMSPSSRAMSEYHWQMPKWFDRLAVTHPTPESFALEIANFILMYTMYGAPRWFHKNQGLLFATHENSPTTTPSPLLPSTQAVAADSFKTVGSADGSQLPDSMSFAHEES